VQTHFRLLSSQFLHCSPYFLWGGEGAWAPPWGACEWLAGLIAERILCMVAKQQGANVLFCMPNGAACILFAA
jgi:hypothetical protein